MVCLYKQILDTFCLDNFWIIQFQNTCPSGPSRENWLSIKRKFIFAQDSFAFVDYFYYFRHEDTQILSYILKQLKNVYVPELRSDSVLEIKFELDRKSDSSFMFVKRTRWNCTQTFWRRQDETALRITDRN